MKHKPCVRCLCKKIKHIVSGFPLPYYTVQCKECSFNVSALSRAEALKKWNGFKVWELVRGIK